LTNSLMYDAILYLYALSLLFYFSDLFGKSSGAYKIGEWLLLFVWLLQSGYAAAHLYVNGFVLSFTMEETFFLFSWVLVTVTLAINRIVRIHMLVFFVNVFGFGALALQFFSRSGMVPLRPEWSMSDELLFIHISLSIGNYAMFVVAAVFSGMYLFLHRQLKGKHWTASMKRLPSLEKLDGYAYRTVIIGAPMLLLALMLGIVWLLLIGESVYLLDWKVLHSLLSLGVYTYYIVQHLTSRAPGHKLAVWNLAAFAVVMMNFILSNSLSAFHQWIWM
jgi:HemX protein